MKKRFTGNYTVMDADFHYGDVPFIVTAENSTQAADIVLTQLYQEYTEDTTILVTMAHDFDGDE